MLLLCRWAVGGELTLLLLALHVPQKQQIVGTAVLKFAVLLWVKQICQGISQQLGPGDSRSPRFFASMIAQLRLNN